MPIPKLSKEMLKYVSDKQSDSVCFYILDAVIPSVAVLIRYIVDHSNLKVKWKSVYRQINRYIGIYQ